MQSINTEQITSAASPATQPSKEKAKSGTKAVAAKKKVAAAPSEQKSVRGDSKAAKLLALLKRPNGATLKELMRASRWQAHSVRGFLSAQVRKRMGLKLRSFEREGERVYAVER